MRNSQVIATSEWKEYAPLMYCSDHGYAVLNGTSKSLHSGSCCPQYFPPSERMATAHDGLMAKRKDLSGQTPGHF